MNNYLKVMIKEMARVTQTELTPDHFKILEFAASYYEKHKVGPLYSNFLRYTGFSRTSLEVLFPQGLKSIYGWTGIPIQTTDDSCKPVPDLFIDDFHDVYMDYNATTPLRKEVVTFLNRYNAGKLGFANPSSGTRVGGRAHRLIEKARWQIGDILTVSPDTIHFTGSGTEANNLAMKGLAFQHLAERGHLIVSKIAHNSILETAKYLQTLGFDLTELDVDSNGILAPETVSQAMRQDTLFVAAMAVNNEIGTINPILKIGSICRENRVPFIVDAVQGFCRIELNPIATGISMLTMSGHKIYAPKGVGAIYIEPGLAVDPLIHGGGQEAGFRAGTESVGAISAFGVAAELACREMASETVRLTALRNYFLENLQKVYPDYVLNGDPEQRVPSNLSIGFRNIDSGTLLLSLNQIGVYVSAGSACSSGDDKQSHVLEAIGVDSAETGTIRFSFGKSTTKENIDYLFKYLARILKIIHSR